MFTIHPHPAGAALPQAVSDLLFDVFVGGGFASASTPRDAFDGAVLAERGEAWIARDDQTHDPIGTIFLLGPENRFRQIAVPGELEIHLVAVAPAARRSGVAQALLSACVEVARARRAERVVLSTQTTMIAAQAMYASRGFRRNASRDWSRPDGRRYLAYELDFERARAET